MSVLEWIHVVNNDISVYNQIHIGGKLVLSPLYPHRPGPRVAAAWVRGEGAGHGAAPTQELYLREEEGQGGGGGRYEECNWGGVFKFQYVQNLVK